MGKRIASNIYFIASFATLGGMLFGFDISSISGVIGTEQYIKYFNNPSSTTQGGFTAAMPGGSFCGALSAGFLADHFSRKYTIQLGAIVWCIGALLQCASQMLAWYIFYVTLSDCSSWSDGLSLGLLLVSPAPLCPSIKLRLHPRISGEELCLCNSGRKFL